MTTHTSLRSLSTLMFAILAVFVSCISALADDNETQTVEVQVRDITLNVPTTWKEEEPLSRLRLTQFRIPAAEGDDEDAELAIFSFGGSDIANNIRRWISQFQADNRTVKIGTGDAEQGKYVFVNISGTFNKTVGSPLDGKTEPVPGSRVLAVILAVPEKGVYYLKMTGLDKTVAAQTDTLRTSFGADLSKENDIKLDE